MPVQTQPKELRTADADAGPRHNKRLIVRLLGLTFAMFAFGYALVPLYDVFCRIAGVGGKTEQITAQQAANLAVDPDRTVMIEFTSNTASGLPWEFATNQRRVRVHPGEVSVATYRAENTASRAVTGFAKFSVTPLRAAKFLNKTDCFCFSNQLLEAGEAKDMPLRFVVDPALPKDVHTITLSYTFFNADKYVDSTGSVEQRSKAKSIAAVIK